MKKLLCLMLPSVIVSTVAYAGTIQKPLKPVENDKLRIQDCIKLLPEGHDYKINLKIVVDKKVPNNQHDIFKELSISDETTEETDKDRKEAIKPFIQCMVDDVY